MLKQRLTLNQGPTQSERTRHRTRDVAMEASDDRAAREVVARLRLIAEANSCRVPREFRVSTPQSPESLGGP